VLPVWKAAPLLTDPSTLHWLTAKLSAAVTDKAGQVTRVMAVTQRLTQRQFCSESLQAENKTTVTRDERPAALTRAAPRVSLVSSALWTNSCAKNTPSIRSYKQRLAFLANSPV
jgi:hypothetical protein